MELRGGLRRLPAVVPLLQSVPEIGHRVHLAAFQELANVGVKDVPAVPIALGHPEAELGVVLEEGVVPRWDLPSESRFA